LIDASNTNEHDTINVAPGHYDISDGTLLYAPGSGGDFGNDTSALTIQGKHASSTVLNGKGRLTPLTIRFIDYDLAGSIEISELEFRQGKGENGGGLFIGRGSNVRISNSNFINNTAVQNGGGASLDASSSILNENRFTGNKAIEDGGGLSCHNCELTGNEFSMNEAEFGGGGGFLSNAIVKDNQFIENKSELWGGGFECAFNCNVTGNIFSMNHADISGGGASMVSSTLVNNTFVENVSGGDGGGLNCHNCEITDNKFSLNTAGLTEDVFMGNGGGLSCNDCTVTDNDFSKNEAGLDGGGGLLYKTSLVDNRFIKNKAGEDGGGLSCRICKVTGNKFFLNTSGMSGGGYKGTGTLTNNRFVENKAGKDGGGLSCSGCDISNNEFAMNEAEMNGGGTHFDSSPRNFYNNILRENRAGSQGGGIYVNPQSSSSTSTLTNNTLTDNAAGTEGGGAYIVCSVSYSNRITCNIANNIIWHNQASTEGNDLYMTSTRNSPTIALSNNNLGQNANFETANSADLVVTDTTNYSQGKNIKRDPLLTDDLHLQYGSPAIDAGDNSAVLTRTDFEGNLRIFDGNGDGKAVVDIGARENTRGDVNQDGCVDRTDADIVLYNVRADSEELKDDINGDGIVNRADVRTLTILFKNPDGAPCATVALDYAKRAGGKRTTRSYGIAVGAADNNVVTGTFYETATFGEGEGNETVLTSVGENDIFVAKYAPNGSLVWAIQAGGTGSDTGIGIAVDSSGNSSVTGFFGGTASSEPNGVAIFGAGEPNETMLTSAGSSDIFVAKYTPDGSLVWAKSAGGTNYDNCSGIAVDPMGNSVITGLFLEKATFGTGEQNETDLTSVGSNDFFIAKYAPDGSLVWANQSGGPSLDQGLGIAIDAKGNSMVTGSFDRKATFGAGNPNETLLISKNGVQEIFVAKYASNGNLLWATQTEGTIHSGNKGEAIAVDTSGDSMVTGSFWGSTTFGVGEPNETTLTSAGEGDVFIAKFHSKP
jgi:hypothetical protein